MKDKHKSHHKHKIVHDEPQDDIESSIPGPGPEDYKAQRMSRAPKVSIAPRASTSRTSIASRKSKLTLPPYVPPSTETTVTIETEKELVKPPPKKQRRGCGCCKKAEDSKPSNNNNNNNKKDEPEGRGRCLKFAACICPYFPVCWNVPLKSSLQFLALLDMFVALGSISLWLYFQQFAPFSERLRTNKSHTFPEPVAPPPYYIPTKSPSLHIIYENELFHESTTVLGPPLIEGRFDAAAASIRYSKLAYLNAKYQQEVETYCGVNYYQDYLFEHRLNITRHLFYEIVHVNYISEGFYIFSDVSIIITTTAFFSYTSAKVFIIFLWELELFASWLKLWTIVVTRSQRLCIVQYGFGPRVRGIDFLLYFYIVPTTASRIYRFLVLSFFVNSFFTKEGYLRGQEETLGPTLKEFVRKEKDYARMKTTRDDRSASSEEDEIDHMI